jgi:hypothetical protein
VFEAAGNDSWTLAAVCTTGIEHSCSVAAAHDMDLDGWPDIIAVGADTGPDNMAVVVCEASGHHRYHQVWEQDRPDFSPGDYGNPISVGDVDGDLAEEFAVNSANGTIVLFKCTGLHTYEQVWSFATTGTYLRLYDINNDGRSEIIFDGPQGTEIWEDTEGLGVAELSKFSLESPVKVSSSVARLGASLLLSGIPPGADIEVHSLDGRLVSRTQVRQSTWTWNLRNQSGNLVPAGTYFAVVRSKGKATSLKLCVVK